MTAATKQCTVCGDVKPLDEFPSDRQKRTGKSPHCLGCNASRALAASLVYASRTDKQIAADRARLRTSGRKRCPRCRRELAFDAFAVCRRAADGLQSWCRTCVWASKRDEVTS
jgi:hypothetical protein